jgi:hypothetical protein
VSRRLLATSLAAAVLAGGCAPLEGRHLDDGELTELEQLLDETGELADQTDCEFEADPQ